MSFAAEPPPAHVLAAFGAGDGVGPEDVQTVADGRSSGFRAGDIVFKRVDDTAEASWLAGVLEQLRVTGIRVARPVRASDGRWVVAGWTVHRFVAGRPEPRYDEIIEASILLHEALAGVAEPRFLRARGDLYAVADRLAWSATTDTVDEVLGEGHAARVFAQFAAGRRPLTLPSQVVHADMFGNVLFAGTAPPAVVDMAPFWRPGPYAAAVIAVDALSWGGADIDLLDRWSHLPEWPELLRRALLFRLAVSLLHPRTTSSSMVEMLSAADLIRPFVS